MQRDALDSMGTLTTGGRRFATKVVVKRLGIASRTSFSWWS
jgi:hypothetical protein